MSEAVHNKERFSITIQGSHGEVKYGFPDGFPLEKPYSYKPENPTEDSFQLVRADFLEYLDFYAHIDSKLPTGVDVLDVAGWNAEGRRFAAESDFRAEYLVRLIGERYGSLKKFVEQFDCFEVNRCTYFLCGPEEDLHFEQNEDQTQDGIYTVYAHLRTGGIEAIFDFNKKENADEMAELLEQKIFKEGDHNDD